MENGSDWVADVRRWVQAGGRLPTVTPPVNRPVNSDATDLGYEAAHPALESRHWPDAAGGLK